MDSIAAGAIVLMYKNEDGSFSPILISLNTQQIIELTLKMQDEPVQVIENVKYLKE